MEKRDALKYRVAPLEISPAEFREVGSRLVEQIAKFLSSLPEQPVAPHESPEVIWSDIRAASLYCEFPNFTR